MSKDSNSKVAENKILPQEYTYTRKKKYGPQAGQKCCLVQKMKVEFIKKKIDLKPYLQEPLKRY